MKANELRWYETTKRQGYRFEHHVESALAFVCEQLGDSSPAGELEAMRRIIGGERIETPHGFWTGQMRSETTLGDCRKHAGGKCPDDCLLCMNSRDLEHIQHWRAEHGEQIREHQGVGSGTGKSAGGNEIGNQEQDGAGSNERQQGIVHV